MSIEHYPKQNRLLAAWPAAAFEHLSARLELVEMPLDKVIYDSDQHMKYVYFPTTSIMSLRYVMENGASAKFAMVGNLGMIGISQILGGDSTSSQAVVISPGHAYRLSARLMHEEFHGNTEVRLLMLRYTQALITQVSQNAVCNRHHSLKQQLACLLLQCLDRQPAKELNLTQDVIASMMGVRREGVTEAALKLQHAGLISYARGHIAVKDLTELAHEACECYDVVKHEFDRLLPQEALLVPKVALQWPILRTPKSQPPRTHRRGFEVESHLGG